MADSQASSPDTTSTAPIGDESFTQIANNSPRMMWPSILLVAALHVISSLANLDVALRSKGPTVFSSMTTALLVVAWVAIGARMGWLHKSKFLLWPVSFWIGGILLSVCAMYGIEGIRGSIIFMAVAIMVTLIVLPCYPIMTVLPLDDDPAIIVAMALICAASLGAYAIASNRWIRVQRKRSPESSYTPSDLDVPEIQDHQRN